MSDAPPAEATPAPAPAAEPAPAVAPVAPVAPVEPATPATPAAPAAQPAGEYPVEPKPGDAAERPYTTTYNGERVDMTEEEFHRLAHMGFEHLAQRQQAQPQQAQQTPEEPNMDSLRQEIAGLRQELNTSTYETRVQGETRRINESVDSEMPKHKVLKDNPALQAMARRNILATLSHNPRLSEEQATKQVASELGSALNAQRENWMKGKISDAGSAEASPGAPGGSTPGTKKLTGKDLMMGKVRDSALRRVGAKELIR